MWYNLNIYFAKLAASYEVIYSVPNTEMPMMDNIVKYLDIQEIIWFLCLHARSPSKAILMSIYKLNAPTTPR